MVYTVLRIKFHIFTMSSKALSILCLPYINLTSSCQSYVRPSFISLNLTHSLSSLSTVWGNFPCSYPTLFPGFDWLVASLYSGFNLYNPFSERCLKWCPHIPKMFCDLYVYVVTHLLYPLKFISNVLRQKQKVNKMVSPCYLISLFCLLFKVALLLEHHLNINPCSPVLCKVCYMYKTNSMIAINELLFIMPYYIYHVNCVCS